MADNDDVPGTPAGDVPPDATRADEGRSVPPEPAAQAPPAQPVLKTRWRDRAWSFRAMLAVALATFLLGGLAGGAVVAASGDDHDDHGRFWMRPGGPGDRMPPGWRHRFEDGGPRWNWNDGPQPPDGQPSPPATTPTPTPSP